MSAPPPLEEGESGRRKFWAMVVAAIAVGGGVGFSSWYLLTHAPAFPTCGPPTLVPCLSSANPSDLSLAIPFQFAQTTTLVPAYANLPEGKLASTYVFDFGDGSPPVVGNNSTQVHLYSTAGAYLVSAEAEVDGVWHTNLHSLVSLPVRSSFASTESLDAPQVAGSIVTNSSPIPGEPPNAILTIGETVTVTASYTLPPANANFTERPPGLQISAGVIAVGGPTITASSATGTYGFAQPGVFWVRFVGSSASPTGQASYQNYTWTVFVAPAGVHGGVTALGSQSSPHPGNLIVYEDWPGGTYSIDPAINYDTIGAETLLNVDQTLIQFNGSQTGPGPASFVPVLSACVPGSSQCTSMFGTSLVRQNNYTFVIDGAARFYDPLTDSSWGVYPTDVLFSVIREMAFADLPCYSCNPGWILGQALLPRGNASWDGGIHVPLNNTPGNTFAHIVLNGSDCPGLARTSSAYHGCVTFRADGAGHSWPYFLDLVAEEQVGEIVPCGWDSAGTQSAGIPYWTYGNVTGVGDHPCPAPGDSGYGTATPPPTGWDPYESIGSVAPYWGNVQYALAGSGPYYLNSYYIGQSYSMAANPAYRAPSFCHGPACEPPAGTYAGTVSVTYESTALLGEVALSNGVADFAGMPTTDTPTLLAMIEKGQARAVTFPTLSTGYFAYNMAFSTQGLSSFLTQPVSIPSDFFTHLAARQFLSRAYPYDEIARADLTVDGIQYGFNYGGAIPQYLAGYYPTNVSWPAGTPCTNANNSTCAAYWWAQGRTTSSPVYDPELAGCRSTAPCTVPVFVLSGRQDILSIATLWAGSVGVLSGGAVILEPVVVDFATIETQTLESPYQNAMPVSGNGFAPDYPDPTDYVTAMYTPDRSWMFSGAVSEQLSLPSENQSGCLAWSDYRAWAAAGAQLAIPEGCQGAALSAMAALASLAAVHPANATRVLMYNWLEQIANGLALYTYAFQFEMVVPFAPWIDGSSVNSNPMLGGSGDQLWFDVTGNGIT